VGDVPGTTEAMQYPGGGFNCATNQRQRVECVLDTPHGLPLVNHQPLHGASFWAVFWFNAHWPLSDWSWQAVLLLTFVVVLLVLAGHWLLFRWVTVGLTGDGGTG
jgi:hypothetical protein